MTKNKVVLVPFPFEDFSSLKVRPVVCLTNPIGTFRHVVVAFITSKIPEELLESDVVLTPPSEDFMRTGLFVASAIRLHRLATVPTRIIKRERGELPPTVAEDVARKLRQLFD